MMMTTAIAMLSTISGVIFSVDGSVIRVFVEDVIMTPAWNDIDNPAFDADAWDNFTDYMTDHGATVSGSVWSTMDYDLDGFSVSVSYSSSDI